MNSRDTDKINNINTNEKKISKCWLIILDLNQINNMIWWHTFSSCVLTLMQWKEETFHFLIFSQMSLDHSLSYNMMLQCRNWGFPIQVINLIFFFRWMKKKKILWKKFTVLTIQMIQTLKHFPKKIGLSESEWYFLMYIMHVFLIHIHK